MSLRVLFLFILAAWCWAGVAMLFATGVAMLGIDTAAAAILFAGALPAIMLADWCHRIAAGAWRS